MDKAVCTTLFLKVQNSNTDTNEQKMIKTDKERLKTTNIKLHHANYNDKINTKGTIKMI